MDSPYSLIALCAILSEFLVSTSVTLLNLRSLDTVPPPELADVYDPKRYEQAQLYSRARARFGLCAGGVAVHYTHPPLRQRVLAIAGASHAERVHGRQ